jgi:hypothetical protein
VRTQRRKKEAIRGEARRYGTEEKKYVLTKQNNEKRKDEDKPFP